MRSAVAFRLGTITFAALALALALTMRSALADPEPFTDAASWIPGHFQVEVLDGADIRPIAADHGLFVVDSFDSCHMLVSNGEVEDEAHLNALLADLRLAWAELAYRQHTPESTRQMVVAVVGGTVEAFVAQDIYNRIGLGALHAHTRGAGSTVAVIDTGMDQGHPALLGQVLAGGYDFIDGDAEPWETVNGIDDDEDGLIDEGAGHGTMVAGIINLVAPEARILPIRALDDDGNGTAFGVARAIRFATEQGVDVINLSLGLPQFSMAIDRAVLRAEAAGIVVVAAAGNEGTDNPPYFPASSPATISVASVASGDVKSDFSNYHKSVDVSAPGELILAPFLAGGWAIGSGTSFATPLISGQAALVHSVAPFLGKIATQSKVEQGTIRIDGIIDNLPYRGMLGIGRFDGARTWALLESATSELEIQASVISGTARWSPSPLPLGQSASLILNGTRLDGTQEVDVTIFDAAGRLLRTLPGQPVRGISWDGRDEDGRQAASGAYFISVSLRQASGEVTELSGSRILVIR